MHEVAGATPDTLARIRMLAREVQRMRYAANDIGLGRGWGYRPHPAAEVLSAGYGDCKDKSNLLCTLLRADGHRAYMLSVCSGNRDRVIPEWPSPSQFNHCIVAIRVPRDTRLPSVLEHPKLGTLMAFDPTDPLTAFGDLPASEQGALALIDDPAIDGLVRLPAAPPESQTFERVIDATLSETGALEAHLMERSAGQAAVQPQRRQQQRHGDRPLGQHAQAARQRRRQPPAGPQPLAAHRLERRQQRQRRSISSSRRPCSHATSAAT